MGDAVCKRLQSDKVQNQGDRRERQRQRWLLMNRILILQQ